MKKKYLGILFYVFCVTGNIFFNVRADAREDNALKNGAEMEEKAVFAAGCFWHVESAFRQVEGVVSVRAGYTGGYVEDPGYEDVCSDETGHVEAVEVKYDPSVVSYQGLLDVFWRIHDPTTFNRQGMDVGSQYRSVIFFCNAQQEEQAKASKEEMARSGKYKRAIVTQILPAMRFYQAEDYHQNYFAKKGLPSCKIK